LFYEARQSGGMAGHPDVSIHSNHFGGIEKVVLKW
jgi:hypothetical protein